MRAWLVIANAAAFVTLTIGCAPRRDAVVVAETGPVFVNIDSPKPIRHTFRVKNDSDHAVAVVRLRTSCNCAQARLTTHRLPPDSATDLTLSYIPDGAWGVDSVHADVFFSDGTVTRYVLRVAWFPRLYLSPRPVQLSVPLGQPKWTSIRCQLFAPSRQALPVYESLNCTDGLTCELTSQEEQQIGPRVWERAYVFRVTAEPTASPGRYRGRVLMTFRTNDGQVLNASADVHWTVLPVLRCRPPVASLGLEGTATVQVVAEDGAAFEIVDVALDPPEAARWLAADINPDGRSIRLTATTASEPQDTPMTRRCTVRIRTTHRKQAEVTLTVLSYVVPR